MAELRLEHLSVGALKSASITIASAEILCLSGRSGSGKSRLLRAVADLEPHGGRIWLGGTEQTTVPGHIWRRQVMMVPADSQWWAERVGEHFSVTDLSAATLNAGLDQLGLDRDVMHWPVSRLSSGEKQRLALLRAVARKPSALLLDEPTANLDSEAVARVEAWLQREIVARQLPVIWVAHDRQQITRVGDRHLAIRGSAVEVVDGSH